MKCVPSGDNVLKGVQCYELFGGIAGNHAFFSKCACRSNVDDSA